MYLNWHYWPPLLLSQLIIIDILEFRKVSNRCARNACQKVRVDDLWLYLQRLDYLSSAHIRVRTYSTYLFIFWVHNNIQFRTYAMYLSFIDRAFLHSCTYFLIDYRNQITALLKQDLSFIPFGHLSIVSTTKWPFLIKLS
jgi:hypothetical protein